MSADRILIIDDEAPIRDLVGKRLARAGFDVMVAADGHAGLAAAADDAPDLIVLDLMMPGIDGFEVCRRLKDDPATGHIPVVFLSASLSDANRQRAFDLGAADFLAKPNQIEELPAYVAAILRTRDPRPLPRGRVISVLGLQANAAPLAARLAETIPLHGPAPVMLMDLDVPGGAIARQFQIGLAPATDHLFGASTGPVTLDDIEGLARRVHSGLRLLPAPCALRRSSDCPPDPARLRLILDKLTAAGHHVVAHLGDRLSDTGLAALCQSELICVVSGVGLMDEDYDRLLSRLADSGIDRRRVVRMTADASDVRSVFQPVVNGRAAGSRRQRGLTAWLQEPAVQRLVGLL